MTLSVVVLSPDTELGRETSKQLVSKGYQVTGIGKNADATALREDGVAFVQADLTQAAELTKAIEVAQPDIVLNLTPQIANTLLHDGHNWKGTSKLYPQLPRHY